MLAFNIRILSILGMFSRWHAWHFWCKRLNVNLFGPLLLRRRQLVGVFRRSFELYSSAVQVSSSIVFLSLKVIASQSSAFYIVWASSMLRDMKKSRLFKYVCQRDFSLRKHGGILILFGFFLMWNRVFRCLSWLPNFFNNIYTVLENSKTTQSNPSLWIWRDWGLLSSLLRPPQI